jgi:hypothetical protein
MLVASLPHLMPEVHTFAKLFLRHLMHALNVDFRRRCQGAADRRAEVEEAVASAGLTWQRRTLAHHELNKGNFEFRTEMLPSSRFRRMLSM